MAAFLLASDNSSTPSSRARERENRDLGVIQPDGTPLEIKIKELTDAEKHKRQ